MSSDTLHDQLQASLGASYTIHRELEGGAMARVFVAREERLGRDVVVKVPGPEQAWGVSAERFAREIRLAAALQDPHIVPLLSAGETADCLPYYTMPYVRGESLRRRLAVGPLSREEALKILTDVARALSYAHEHGVVHRDIKPANILLSSGTAVVTDFGIAKALHASRLQARDEDEAEGNAEPSGHATMALREADAKLRTTGLTMTGTGASLGTPAYMAPEQSVGDDVGPSADVYAWGVVAYELLAGVHPFADCESAQKLLAAHLARVPAPLAPKAPGLPRKLAALVLRCLAKSPAERPRDGAELLAALSRATAARTPSHRERAITLATVAAAVVALVLGGESFLRARSAEAAGPPLVAVLPFESVGPVADTLFAGALEDAVAGKLSRLAGLRVIDRQSVTTARKASAGAQQIGRALGADFVLRATVRWGRDTSGVPEALVAPTLVRVKDGTTKWSGDAEVVRPSDPFTVQATLATRVVEALDVALAPRERDALRALPTQDTAALAAYTRGVALREQAAASGNSAPLLRALREFERAYRLDPKYPAPYAAAARILWALSWAGATPQVRADSVDALAARALALDSLLPQAIEMRATLAYWRDDWRTPKALLERAVRAAPSDLKLLTLLADQYIYAGEVDSGWVATVRSVRLAPRSPEVLDNAGFVATALQRFDQAERWYRQLLALEPERADRWLNLTYVAGSRGDTTLMNEALHAFRARGGHLAVRTLADMFAGGSALVREARAATLESLGASTEVDSMIYYMNMAEDRLLVGDVTSARAFVDSGLPIARRRARLPQAAAGVGRQRQGVLAWFLAGAGDSAGALAALRRFMDDPEARARPRGDSAADIAGVAARVYGLLGDVDAMLPQLARAITPPGSFTPAMMRRDPAIARHLGDPRVRAVVR